MIWNCVVIDDGSSDETLSIAKKVAAADGRFLVIQNDKSQGLAAARNLGLRAASGTWVTFLDADDFLFPSALARRVQRLGESPLGVIGCYGDWVSVPERTMLLPFRRRAAKREDVWLVPANRSVPFIASAPLLKRDLVLALGGFDESAITAEDAEFWQWWLRLNGRTVYEPTLCVAYRRRADSMTRRDPVEHFRAIQAAFVSFDLEWNDAPKGVLGRTDAYYRVAAGAAPGACFTAAGELAERSDEGALRVIEAVDSDVLRLMGSTRLSTDAYALAVRRTRGTSGSRGRLEALKKIKPSLLRLLSESESAAITNEELLQAAHWLCGKRKTNASKSSK